MESYRLSGAASVRIFADDLRSGMVVFYLFSDTVARKYEELESNTWTLETQQKCGLCHGSFFIVEGPVDKGKEFDEHIHSYIGDIDHFIDFKLKQEMSMLPGRHFSVIHARNADKYKTLYGHEADFKIQKNGRVELEKDTLTGIYNLDIF